MIMKTFSEFLDEALLPSLIKAVARQVVKSKALRKAVPKTAAPEKVKLASTITGFQTERGSKYTYNPKQGSWPQTQRTAAKDPYHTTAPGVKQKSDYTMFTTPDDSMTMRDNFVSKGAVNPQTKEPFFKGLRQSPTPRRGRAPVEVWNQYAEKGNRAVIHPGSPITDIQTTTRGSNVGLYGAQRQEIRDRVKAELQRPANIEDIKRQLGIKPKNSSVRNESVKEHKSFSEFIAEVNTLNDLRSVAAKATMAGPSKEAQSLMSTRTKNILGPEKLSAGISAQQGVETMRSSIPSPSSTPLPAPNATWAKANPKLATAYNERQRIRGTAQTDNPLMKDMRSNLSLTPSVQSKDVATLGKGFQSLTQNPNAAKPSTIVSAKPSTLPTSTSVPKPTPTSTPVPTTPAQPKTGLSDAEKQRIDDFRALGPLQKLQQKSQLEKELASLSPEQRQQVMDYYKR